MDKEEIRELMKEKFDEIDWNKYSELKCVGEFCCHCSDGELHFKPKESKPEFPIVFENDTYAISIRRTLPLEILHKQDRVIFSFFSKTNFDLLKQAMAKLEELENGRV